MPFKTIYIHQDKTIETKTKLFTFLSINWNFHQENVGDAKFFVCFSLFLQAGQEIDAKN